MEASHYYHDCVPASTPILRADTSVWTTYTISCTITRSQRGPSCLLSYTSDASVRRAGQAAHTHCEHIGVSLALARPDVYIGTRQPGSTSASSPPLLGLQPPNRPCLAVKPTLRGFSVDVSRVEDEGVEREERRGQRDRVGRVIASARFPRKRSEKLSPLLSTPSSILTPARTAV